MTDDQTGMGASAAGSNPAAPSAESNDGVEEARIIEEVIIAPAAPRELKDALGTPTLPPPPQPVVPIEKPLAPSIPPPAPIQPKPEPAAPRKLSSSALSAGMMSVGLPPAFDVPRIPAEKIAPAAPLAPIPPPATISETKSPTIVIPTEPKKDFGKILGEVKLPERVVVPDKKVEPENKTAYDTSLASPFAPSGATQINLSNEAIPKGEPAGNAASATSEAPSPKTVQTVFESAASIVAPLRTLKNDFQDIVRDKKMSLVRAAALEQDKKRRPDRMKEFDASNPRKSRVFTIVFSVILLAVLGSAAFFGIALVTREQNEGTGAPSDTSLLFAESTVPLILENLSSFDLKGLLAQARIGGTGTLGSITRILPLVSVPASETEPEMPLERAATLEEFLRALNARVSPDLMRALNPEFFFGMHTVDENAFLFVIPVLSYEHAFADMLEWEEVMNADLAPAFTTVPETKIGESGLLEKRAFEDLIMRNYDVRALKDDQGVVQLYYSFPTREFLIISESPYSFTEILSRLRAERRL